jgi:hypothetical protein
MPVGLFREHKQSKDGRLCPRISEYTLLFPLASRNYPASFPFRYKMWSIKSVEYVKATAINTIFEECFGLPLIRNGFTHVSDRKWIRRRTPDFADLFEIQALKGASYSPLWGFSLNFVPHLSGKNVRFHSTDKSALFDYRYDPLDINFGSRKKQEEWIISRFDGLKNAKRNAKRSARRAIPLAMRSFSQINNIPDLIKLYAESLQSYRSRTPSRFGFFNYSQYPIAYAFLLSRQGKYDEGLAILQEAVKLGIDYGSAFNELLAKMRRLAESL